MPNEKSCLIRHLAKSCLIGDSVLELVVGVEGVPGQLVDPVAHRSEARQVNGGRLSLAARRGRSEEALLELPDPGAVLRGWCLELVETLRQLTSLNEMLLNVIEPLLRCQEATSDLGELSAQSRIDGLADAVFGVALTRARDGVGATEWSPSLAGYAAGETCTHARLRGGLFEGLRDRRTPRLVSTPGTKTGSGSGCATMIVAAAVPRS